MRRVAAWGLAGLLLAASCGSDGDEPEPSAEPLAPPVVVDEVGEPEGELNLLAFAGYAEDGSSDPDFDWVLPFQRATGCAVSVRYVDSGAEIVERLARPDSEIDGATVPGDVAGELIAARAVAAVDPELFPAWENLLAPLREGNAGHYVVDGQVFGVPALYGPNLLLYDTDRVRTEPRSWDVLFAADSPYAGRIAQLDSPMAIADAALYLAAHEPALGIADPFALSREQLDAAAALLEDQAERVGAYWRLFTDEVDAFADRRVVVGMGWPIAVSLLEIDGHPVGVGEPSEGITGWADTWMIAAEAPHPNCMVLWMRWTMHPDVQARMALWYGGAPSNEEACAVIRKELGDLVELADGPRLGRCGDESFVSSLALWRTPTVECGDGRDRSCTGVAAWRAEWEAIRS